MWSRCICCYNLHYRLTKLMTITDTSKIFRCSSQDPALITFKGTVLFNILIFGTKWNLSQLISANEIVFLPHHVFMGAQWVGTASYSRDTVSPRVISVVVDSQSSYSWFSDLLLILRTPHQFICEIINSHTCSCTCFITPGLFWDFTPKCLSIFAESSIWTRYRTVSFKPWLSTV